MDDTIYAIKKTDMKETGYIIVPASCFIEVPSEPEYYKDGDEEEY